MFSEFAETNQENLDALNAALAARSIDDVNEVAHCIKGACKIIGAAEAADWAYKLKQVGDAGDWDRIEYAPPRCHTVMDGLMGWISEQVA